MKEYVEKNDVSHGIILMVDMGSLRGIIMLREAIERKPTCLLSVQ